MDNNGAAVKDGLTPDGQPPPWAMVDPQVILEALTRQLAAAHLEMTAMRLYIDQLHDALAQVAAVPGEEPHPAGRPA